MPTADELIALWKGEDAPLLPLLHAFHERDGFLSEDALRAVRAERGLLPRAVNLVSGPSRTGDIAMKIILGAHGPRRLHVVLIADD